MQFAHTCMQNAYGINKIKSEGGRSMKVQVLADLPIGKTARVGKISAKIAIKGRLWDIGLVEGSEISCLYAAPSGEPRAYRIKGSVIALRREDAVYIEIVS